jgi:transposase
LQNSAVVRGLPKACITPGQKQFLEAGKRRLNGDTERAASTPEVKDLRREVRDMKELVADLTLENRLLKKSMSGVGGDQE